MLSIYSLNRKQTACFELITRNVILKYRWYRNYRNLSLSFKLTFETRKRKREETDESIIESMVDDGMDLLMSSFEE